MVGFVGLWVMHTRATKGTHHMVMCYMVMCCGGGGGGGGPLAIAVCAVSGGRLAGAACGLSCTPLCTEREGWTHAYFLCV